MEEHVTNKQAIDLLSLNTNGLRDGRKRRGLFNWLKKFHDAHNKIILLQETHTNKNNETEWLDDCDDRNIIFARTWRQLKQGRCYNLTQKSKFYIKL
jgi:exonuclease III